jgi:hypothetical protein
MRLGERIAETLGLAAPVKVERGPFAARLCAGLGTRGVALEGRVFLAPEADARVLAHEVAHVAQQRLRGPARPRLAEAEAHHAAARLLRGWGARVAQPLDPREPACWEEVGHYYTTYYVLLAAGVRDDLARRIAFYTQLPDEVSDLDAYRAGVAMPGQAVSGIGEWLYDNSVGRLEDAYIEINNGFARMLPFGGAYTMGARRRGRSFDQMSQGFDVQQGLHALTGATAEVETTRRIGILNGLDPVRDTLIFGLALHAFGDSYAHRAADGVTMYPPGAGHGPDSGLARAGRRAHLPEMHVHPDAVGPYHADLYIRYARAMLGLFLLRVPPGQRPGTPLTADGLEANLRRVIASSNAAADTPAEHARQIALLREMARAIVPAGMHAYAPENEEDVPLDRFRPSTDIVVTQREVRLALGRAEEWGRLP